MMAATGGEPSGSEAVLFERARTSAVDALGEERLAELLEEGRGLDPLPRLRSGEAGLPTRVLRASPA
jgi:hypothetical protein